MINWMMGIASTRSWMAASILLVVGGITGLIWSGWGVEQFGTISSWFAALGTVGALAFAARTFFKSEERKRQQYAEKVSAVVNDRQGDEWMVTLYNRSEGPIFDVIVTIEAMIQPYGVVGMDRWWCLRPADIPLTSFIRAPAIANQSLKEVSFALAQAENSHHYSFNFGVGLRFRDQAGRDWHRDVHGNLVELNDAAVKEPIVPKLMAQLSTWQHKAAGFVSPIADQIVGEVQDFVFVGVSLDSDGNTVSSLKIKTSGSEAVARGWRRWRRSPR